MADPDDESGRTHGRGLALGTMTGDYLRLAIVGYQFPEAADRDKRCSWYVVHGAATVAGRGWEFRWQALTCADAPLISRWLRELATWANEPSSELAPTAPWLIEPNLQFRSASKSDGVVELMVELDLEFLPPERRRGRIRAGRPEVLRLQTSPDELAAAATKFDATIARFPDLSGRA